MILGNNSSISSFHLEAWLIITSNSLKRPKVMNINWPPKFFLSLETFTFHSSWSITHVTPLGQSAFMTSPTETWIQSLIPSRFSSLWSTSSERTTFLRICCLRNLRMQENCQTHQKSPRLHPLIYWSKEACICVRCPIWTTSRRNSRLDMTKKTLRSS